MATGFVPSPPNEDFLEGLFSQRTQPHYYGGSHQFNSSNYLRSKSSNIPQPFGGESFYDHISQLTEEDEHGRSGTLFPGQQSVVPYTPAIQRAHPSQAPPDTNEQRIHFPYDDSGERNVIGLRPVTEIPTRYQSVFSSFSHFNLIQSKVFDDVLYTDKHLVTSAPTGSGKTVIFELAIVRVLMRMSGSFNSLKIVYVAPIKALCNERYEEWSVKFSSFGIKCAELTGDSQLDDYFELQNAQIIMTTPEKWDSMTRKWRDNKSLVQLVQLFLLDEVHQLNDESRGPTVEAIVSRMKTIRTSVARDQDPSSHSLLRFMAISATIPNIKDIACWLGSEDQPAIIHSIDDSHRPVQLRRVVLGFPDANTEFKFDLSLNYKLSGIIQCYSDQKPSLIFCATRKGTQQAACVLVKDARFVMNMEHRRKLQSIASTINDSKLRDLVVYGVGYHHAGLSTNDRKLIETMFTAGELPVLFATSTLAMGVNLPAHLVVIKSTLHYVGGMFQEYSESQILQMIGRAGRPQFDTSATAVILTRQSTKYKYEALLSGSQLIESNLHSHLIEHLNAEIVLDTVTDVSIALEWLKSTFLYIRIKKNPKHYNIPEGIAPDILEEKLQEMCLKDLHLLESCGLINMEDGFTLLPTDKGKLMARYYVAFESMKSFLNLKGTESLGELVEELSKCEEFNEVRLRVNEKRILNQLNKDKHRATIRFPMSSKIKSTDMKVNCLLQATLGCLPLQEFSLNQDTQKIFRSSSRLCRCLMELALLDNKFNKLLNSVLLYKCIQSKLWENSKFVVRQLDKIGLALSTSLVNAGVTTFNKLLETNPRELEMIVNRHPPFGNQVRETASRLPNYSLTIEQVQSSTIVGGVELVVTINMMNYTVLKEVGSTGIPSHTCMLVIGNVENELITKQKITDSQLLSTGTWSKRVIVSQCKRRKKDEDVLQIHFISLEYVGLDIHQTFTPTYTTSSGSMRNHSSDSYDDKNLIIKQQVEPCNQLTVQSKGKGSVKNRQKTCGHRCINKAVCGHDCCKYGLESHTPSTSSSISCTTPSTSTSSATPTSSSVYRKGQPFPSTMNTSLKRKNGVGGDMTSHINELHHRVQSIPATPGLKRMKLISSNYKDYLFTPSTTRREGESGQLRDYCYVSKPKLSEDKDIYCTEPPSHEELACSFYEEENTSPPPLPSPLVPLLSSHDNTNSNHQFKTGQHKSTDHSNTNNSDQFNTVSVTSTECGGQQVSQCSNDYLYHKTRRNLLSELNTSSFHPHHSAIQIPHPHHPPGIPHPAPSILHPHPPPSIPHPPPGIPHPPPGIPHPPPGIPHPPPGSIPSDKVTSTGLPFFTNKISSSDDNDDLFGSVFAGIF